MSKTEIRKQIGISTNEIYKYWEKLSETALRKQQLAPFIEHPTTLLIRKLVKLKSSIARKFSKARLKFNIVIVPSKTEIVQSMQIAQSALKFIGKTSK